jgi:hypothetical protein
VFADPPAFAEPPEPVDDGLLLHAAASRARAAVAMVAAAVRAVRGDARRGRRMTRVLSFMMPSSGAGPWLRLVAGVHRDGCFPVMGRSVRVVRGTVASPV